MRRFPLITPVRRLGRDALKALIKAERGQVIWWMLLIIPLFAIGAAIVVDSSVWYLHRRGHQNTADASALAGAQELLVRTTTGQMTSDALQAADDWKTYNERPPADFANDTPEVVDNCWGVTSYDGKPDGVIVDVSKDAPLLFMRAFQVAGFSIGAHAKVCVGSPQLADTFLPLGMPVLDSRCFDNGVPLFGQECNVALRPSAGNSGEAQYLRLYDDGDPNSNPADWSRLCSDSNANTSNQDLENQFARGAHTWCAVAPPGSSCPPSSQPDVGYCMVSDAGNRAKWAMNGIQTRLASEGPCNSEYGPDFGTSGNGIDDWWEALCAEGVGCGTDLLNVQPGPDVTFVKRDCSSDGSALSSPRVVNIILLDQFPAGGNCSGQNPCAISGFAGFFIEGCYDDANENGQRDAGEPFDAKCREKQNGGPLDINNGHIYILGMFINYVDIGGPGGPATPYGRMQLYLVE